MLERIEKILFEDCLLDREPPLLVGVSGGPDSLCLMDALHQLGFHITVAHFDHGLRPDSGREADALQIEMQKRRIPYVTRQGDVRSFAHSHSQTLEEAARNLRYEFLFQQALETGAQAVAVGHTADDQVETILMHLLRGAGLAGLRGMEYRKLPNPWSERVPLVRPLLSFWREEILDFIRRRDLRPFFDETNTDRRFFRNRIRLELLPLLESLYPQARKRLLQTSQILAAEDEVLEGRAREAWSECDFEIHSAAVGFNRQTLLRQPPALRRRLLRRAIGELQPGLCDIDFDTIARADSFLAKPSRSGRADLAAGLRIENLGERTWLARWGVPISAPGLPQIDPGKDYELALPIVLHLNDGWLLEGAIRPASPEQAERARRNQDPWRAWLDLDRLKLPLRMRTRRPGDRFSPLGMGGHSLKISDFMINARIPRQNRSAWPLIVSGAEIAWVPGHSISDRFAVDDDSQVLLELRLSNERRIKGDNPALS